MKMRAQISTEFIMITSVMLIIFLMMFSIIDKRDNEVYSGMAVLSARTEGDKLANNINSVFLAKEGAKKTIILPETLKDGNDYLVAIYPSDRLVEVRWNSLEGTRTYTSTIVTSKVTGYLSAISNTSLTISNIEGGVVIE